MHLQLRAVLWLGLEMIIRQRCGRFTHDSPHGPTGKTIGERFKPIRFHLMANLGVSLDDVKVVSSMPMALSQCRNTLRRSTDPGDAGHVNDGSRRRDCRPMPGPKLPYQRGRS
jgi:hypothetical protein